MQPLLSLKDITKTYETGNVSYQALKGIDLEIETDEFVAIMGHSGSGKSTLMNILGALDSPTTGRYELDGRDVSALSDDELAQVRNRRIGFVFQSFNLLPRMTVIKNVERPMIYAGTQGSERRTRAIECLKMVGLEDKAGNLSNQLSGGEIQRVAVARALVMNPSIILADEPTGNLDSETAAQMMRLFQDLNNQGRTVVLITHEHDIAAFAQRIVRLKDGRIIADGN